MMDKKTNDILVELKNKISQKYKLIEMRLFGSKARGDNGSHSDIDIFVRISDVNRTIEEGIFDLAYEVELKHGCLIDIFVFDDKALNGIYFWTPVYQNILREGFII
ncbi:MAG: nucleotidyltransferase domain-containing protein [Thermodesulfobacteriota bacterium]|nr:nucleotidyltransferase domain-containing protein [Thermodesulfobacteriota bacterium]